MSPNRYEEFKRRSLADKDKDSSISPPKYEKFKNHIKSENPYPDPHVNVLGPRVNSSNIPLNEIDNHKNYSIKKRNSEPSPFPKLKDTQLNSFDSMFDHQVQESRKTIEPFNNGRP